MVKFQEFIAFPIAQIASNLGKFTGFHQSRIGNKPQIWLLGTDDFSPFKKDELAVEKRKSVKLVLLQPEEWPRLYQQLAGFGFCDCSES